MKWLKKETIIAALRWGGYGLLSTFAGIGVSVIVAGIRGSIDPKFKDELLKALAAVKW
jgi:hypothetical protein